MKLWLALAVIFCVAYFQVNSSPLESEEQSREGNSFDSDFVQMADAPVPDPTAPIPIGEADPFEESSEESREN